MTSRMQVMNAKRAFQCIAKCLCLCGIFLFLIYIFSDISDNGNNEVLCSLYCTMQHSTTGTSVGVIRRIY